MADIDNATAGAARARATRSHSRARSRSGSAARPANARRPSHRGAIRDSAADPVATERTRIAAILNAPEAQGREALARTLALETNQDPETARSAFSPRRQPRNRRPLPR